MKSKRRIKRYVNIKRTGKGRRKQQYERELRIKKNEMRNGISNKKKRRKRQSRTTNT